MNPLDPSWQHDLPHQIDSFDEFLVSTAELYDRRRVGLRGLSYDEAELDAFYHGWNAAVQHLITNLVKHANKP